MIVRKGREGRKKVREVRKTNLGVSTVAEEEDSLADGRCKTMPGDTSKRRKNWRLVKVSSFNISLTRMRWC